jgi:hypothetical protein
LFTVNSVETMTDVYHLPYWFATLALWGRPNAVAFNAVLIRVPTVRCFTGISTSRCWPVSIQLPSGMGRGCWPIDGVLPTRPSERERDGLIDRLPPARSVGMAEGVSLLEITVPPRS